MKRFFSILLAVFSLLLLTTNCYNNVQDTASEHKQAKYVFYFIGDGMGLAQVSLAEAFQSHQNGAIGSVPVSFSKFPVFGTATTFSASNIITCSSAAGTALATGTKTNNGMLGVTPSGEPLKAISYKIKEAGYKVGVTTTVTLDHATPGAFYAHSNSRNDYYSIALELPKTGFDFFAGGGFLQPTGMKKDQTPILDVIAKEGYTIAYGVDEFEVQRAKANKMVLLQAQDRAYMKDLPYAIDRQEGDLTQAQIVEAAIKYLDNQKGFFLMSEGGKIDWAGHSNDAKTNWMEVLDFSSAVDVAVAFAQKHPNETLIVVTADHETGGLSLAYESQYVMHFEELDGQNTSIDVLNAERKKEEVAEIREMQKRAKIGWTTSSHSGIPVPVYAMGVGSENFSGRIDNTDIPKKICQIMGVAF